jgi:NADP-dependent 3-hydroxy acid dehydrogenase YdfG
VRDLFSIEGKVALVTGGSRGIGLMIARGYAENGARVYVSSRDAEACAKVAAELSKVGTCAAIPGDLAKPAEVKRVAGELAAREPALHILVNNAGANWGAPLEEYPDSAWDKVLALNVKSVFHLTVALLPQLAAAATPDDPARVINIGSIDGIQVPLLETYAYSASKARRAPPDARARAQARAARHHRELRRARAVREQDDGRHAREVPRLAREDDPAQADRRARGHGRDRDLPRVARGAPTSPAP